MIELVELKEICNISSGGTPSRNNSSFYKGEIKWAKISDLEKAGDGFIYDTEEKITTLGLKNIRNRVFESETLFLAMYGSVGKTAITKNKMSCNQAILGITAKDDEKLNLKYLRYWLDSNKEKLLNSAKGVALKNLSAGMVKDLKIPLPLIEIQKDIAEILDNAASLRDKTKQILEEYDQLVQSIFLEMFGDPVTNPMGWKTEELEKSIDFLTSGSRGWAKYYADQGDIFLRIQNIGYNRFKTENLTYVNAPESTESKRTKVKSGDILISITADLARTGVVPSNFSTAYIKQHLAIIRLKKKYVPEFVSAYIASNGGQALFQKLDKGGVKAGLNFSDLKSYPLFIAPHSEQIKFKVQLEIIDQQKDLAKQELKESEDLFQALLQKAFKGELVKEEKFETA